jgi:hypothetical protein
MKGVITHAVAFILGCAICGGVIYLLSYSASAKLKSELGIVRTSLADAVDVNKRLTDTNKQLQDSLNVTNSLVTKQRVTIASQQQRIAGQQLSIDAAKRGLEELATNLASGIGSIAEMADAIRQGFARLYAIYHPGAVGLTTVTPK